MYVEKSQQLYIRTVSVPWTPEVVVMKMVSASPMWLAIGSLAWHCFILWSTRTQKVCKTKEPCLCGNPKSGTQRKTWLEKSILGKKPNQTKITIPQWWTMRNIPPTMGTTPWLNKSPPFDSIPGKTAPPPFFSLQRKGAWTMSPAKYWQSRVGKEGGRKSGIAVGFVL